MPQPHENFPQQGAALLTALVFLEIFTLLFLYTIRTSLWNSQNALDYWQSNQLSAAAMRVLTDTEHELSQNNFPCKITLVPRSVLQSQAVSWWQSNACAGKINFFQYYFVLEELGEAPCAILSSGEVARYYRLTLLMVTTARAGEKTLLQSTIIKPGNGTLVCTSSRHYVQPGRQSLRQLV
jgi:hypothetical protein